MRRIEWCRQLLAELARAFSDGANVRAFHAWTPPDNSSGRKAMPSDAA
nr:hypothetical protein [Rhizobium rhizogenes]